METQTGTAAALCRDSAMGCQTSPNFEIRVSGHLLCGAQVQVERFLKPPTCCIGGCTIAWQLAGHPLVCLSLSK